MVKHLHSLAKILRKKDRVHDFFSSTKFQNGYLHRFE